MFAKRGKSKCVRIFTNYQYFELRLQTITDICKNYYFDWCEPANICNYPHLHISCEHLPKFAHPCTAPNSAYHIFFTRIYLVKLFLLIGINSLKLCLLVSIAERPFHIFEILDGMISLPHQPFFLDLVTNALTLALRRKFRDGALEFVKHSPETKQVTFQNCIQWGS